MAFVDGAVVPIIHIQRRSWLAHSLGIANFKAVADIVVGTPYSRCGKVENSDRRIALIFRTRILIVQGKWMTDTTAPKIAHPRSMAGICGRASRTDVRLVDGPPVREAGVEGAGVSIVRIQRRAWLTDACGVAGFFSVARIKIRAGRTR
jgi:hypothetical protein